MMHCICSNSAFLAAVRFFLPVLWMAGRRHLGCVHATRVEKIHQIQWGGIFGPGQAQRIE